jgi:hypothetical protein
MSPEDAPLRLSVLPQGELDVDTHPGDPFRLEFPGYWQTTPDGRVVRANITVRLNSSDITALKAQIRAAELSYATRMGRMTDEQLARSQFEAAVADKEPPDAALLELVLERLRVA